MSHAYSRIWVHAIWSTKNRLPFIAPAIEQRVYGFITKELADLKCSSRIINGMPDHLHAFFLLHPTQALSGVIKQIKGASSEYVNRDELTSKKFSWQIGYSAFSVSESAANRVYRYILNQKRHHQKQSFESE